MYPVHDLKAPLKSTESCELKKSAFKPSLFTYKSEMPLTLRQKEVSPYEGFSSITSIAKAVLN